MPTSSNDLFEVCPECGGVMQQTNVIDEKELEELEMLKDLFPQCPMASYECLSCGAGFHRQVIAPVAH